MRATTDITDALIPATALDFPSDKAMTALYRVALGPVNASHYQPVFARFDATGRTTTSWNWAAGLFTLNWMVFRQLWSAALVYVAAAEGLALLVFGMGRSWLQWPQGVEWGVLGAFALLAIAVPGLYGDALLHTDIRKRIARALAASRTVPEACAVLDLQASSRKRFHTVVLANLVLAAAAALAYLLVPSSAGTARTWNADVTVAEATSAAVAQAMKDSAAASAPAVQATPSTPLTPSPPSVPSVTDDAARPAAHAWASGAVQPAAPADAPVAAATTPASSPLATPPRVAAAPEKANAPANSTAAPPTVGTTAGYYINVGLFAEEANARKAQARLLNEGLPAFRQKLTTHQGPRTRLRVGPYDSRAQANAAAASVRALALDAVVFKQAR